MDRALPRLRSISGVAHALMRTVGIADATVILIDQFGWDVTVQALAHLADEDACRALWLAVAAGHDDR